MSTNKNVNAAKGRRYSEKEKAEILAYVDKVNGEKGRGGQSAAAKKYKISQLTISSWIKGSGAVGGKGGANGALGSKLAKLSTLANQIDKAEKELEKAEKELSKLRSQFESLKGSL